MSDRGQRDAVYVLDMDTLEARPATSDVGQGGDFDPAWHPDGDRLVFSRLGPDGHDLYVVDVPAPGEAPNLPRPFASTSGSDQRPAWSPGPERSVAFHSIEGDRIDVYVVDEDGSNPRRLTDHPARDFHPSWSHDGSVIAFASERGDGTRRIYRMDPDGSGVELLRSDVDVRGWDPNWCAAGDRVAFQSDREGGRNQVFWVDAAGGGGVEQVTTLGGADPSW